MDIEPSTQAMIDEWYSYMAAIEPLATQMAPFIMKEKALRAAIVAILWPADKPENEGTQRADLPLGYKLKANVKIDRKVIEEVVEDMIINLQKAMINTTDLFKTKHELNLKVYRSLTAEQQKMVNSCLDIKPASPTLELELPKKA